MRALHGGDVSPIKVANGDTTRSTRIYLDQFLVDPLDTIMLMGDQNPATHVTNPLIPRLKVTLTYTTQNKH